MTPIEREKKNGTGMTHEWIDSPAADIVPLFPDEINGCEIYRRYEDVPLDHGHFDVSSVALGQPVVFIAVGPNLFAMSERKILGRVTARKKAAKIGGWLRDGKPVQAVVTDADAADDELKISVALYDDVLGAAREKNAAMIRLSGVKGREAQKNIAAVRVGTTCEAVFDAREDRWKVYTPDGFVGYLPAEAYRDDGSRRIVAANVTKNTKKDRLDIRVYVI